MNPEIKAKWVARLQSPGLKQGPGNLKKIDNEGNIKRCCLGVLCEIAVEEGVDLEVTQQVHANWTIVEFDGFIDYLPPKVTDWAELDTPNPRASEEASGVPSGVSLGFLNDHGWTFRQIADIIERAF